LPQFGFVHQDLGRVPYRCLLNGTRLPAKRRTSVQFVVQASARIAFPMLAAARISNNSSGA
jgi:hypothetical protein